MRMQFQSLSLLSGLRIRWCCHELWCVGWDAARFWCCCGCGYGWQLQPSLIQPLAWKISYAADAALKTNKQTNKRMEALNFFSQSKMCDLKSIKSIKNLYAWFLCNEDITIKSYNCMKLLRKNIWQTRKKKL